jgi:hypothetical protein
MAQLQYRITDDVLLSINLTDSARVDFRRVSNMPQWLIAGEIDKVVWSSGVYGQRLNKTFAGSELIPLSGTVVDNQRIMSGNLLVRQGFSWDNIFGILLVVRGMESGNYLCSRLWQVSDMLLTQESDIQLIDGAFWPYSVPFTLPNLSNEALMASVVYVTYDTIISDGPNIGFISNYPINATYFESLNQSAPLPDYIQTKVEFDNNQYVIVTPITLETNKTLQQSILDYFGFSNNVVPIAISHTVRYGNDTTGYQTVKISNEDNSFEPVKVGFDFTPWANSGLISVFVITEITCNNVTLARQQNSLFDLQDNVAPFLNAVVADQELTVYPIDIVQQNIVNNTVIETVRSVKIVPILQPVYVEMQQQDIAFENKNISFPTVNVQSILDIAVSNVTEEQFILSQQTEDGKFYFDLTNAIAPVTGTKYKVVDSQAKTIITKGTITVN